MAASRLTRVDPHGRAHAEHACPAAPEESLAVPKALAGLDSDISKDIESQYPIFNYETYGWVYQLERRCVDRGIVEERVPVATTWVGPRGVDLSRTPHLVSTGAALAGWAAFAGGMTAVPKATSAPPRAKSKKSARSSDLWI